MFDELKKKAKAKAYDVTGTIPPKEVPKPVEEEVEFTAFHTPNPFDDPKFVADLQELDEFEAEKIHANAPRKNCREIAPAVEKFVTKSEENTPHAIKHKLHLYHRIIKRNRAKNPEKHVKHLAEFDWSERIVPHGNVSLQLYNNIAKLRNFDIYGRPLDLSDEEIKERAERKLIEDLGKVYKNVRPPDRSEEIRQAAVPVFDHNEPFKAQPITTEKWKVGMKEIYNPPVGFARDPGEIFNSEGRETYYSYDGEWKDGLMDGEGVYRFEDGKTYSGLWKQNKPHGIGTAVYPIGSTYSGEWKNGKFHGEGVLEAKGGIRYEGVWKYGKRWGKGKVVLRSGLEYDGDWVDGKPHGRGIMKSVTTGYVYEGTFVKGSIEGSGVITTPPPESKRIVRYWPHSKNGMSLPGVVKLLRKEEEDFFIAQRKQKKLVYGVSRKLKIDSIVSEMRVKLHEGRAKEKRDALNEQMALIREQKQKMREAKIRALAGDDAPEESSDSDVSSDSDD
mmetsp:Transcript_19436/g.36231  ORF Transcript_19436/g.36231 Transcript_19436/m.36231 type:complete len:503 (-) Transcript_19436:15-1523(-)